MVTTTRVRLQQAGGESAATLRWRVWPLVDARRWSWTAIVAVIGAGLAVWQLGGGWLLGLVAAVGLAFTLRQFLLPAQYEVAPLGIRRSALRRSRLVPWHAVRAYQPRHTGVVLYQRSDPTKLDLLRSLFVPYPDDADELLTAIRPHLSHAVELSQ